ncbi:histone deacetylase complex subunit SAP130 isoform X2 [Photinus pyralis]|uniref:histone deacetylase complex subunit SAP130 isoform X2 n=1 Tax=Photinus pyralis TaxID=7054 RepID=UPI0012671BEB|nr:histone deacetylase complex subunit SAP130 isoform X2 [Photinus pyralis]
MSGTTEDEKSEAPKAFPLDLAAKIATVKTMDGKTPLVMTGQPLRNMRVLTQPASGNSGQTSVVTPAIITTNIVPQVLKQCDTSRAHAVSTPGTASITLQRPAQITLAASLPVVASSLPVVSQNTYHVPRGPAVVANLAAPRSNVVGSIRTPMVVTAQANAFIRPPRAPSPAQGTAWLTSSSNGSQIKGAPTVLSPPVRGATVSGTLAKPQLLTRAQPLSQTTSTIRPTTATILHSAITIGQGAQLHSFKPNQGATAIQTLGSTVTLAQVIPSRTQTLVYSTNGTQFTSAPRLTIASTIQNRLSTTSKAQVTTARLTMPIVSQGGSTRLVAPQGTVLTTGARISTVPTTQQPTPPRIVSTTQSTVTLGRLSVSVTSAPTQVSSVNVLGQTRISTLSLHPLVAVANNAQPRTIQAQTAKVIAQPVQGNTVSIPQMSSVMKPNPIATTTRTISVQQANMVTQRPITAGATQAVAISKVFPQSVDNQSNQATTNIFIHTPMASVPRKSSPGPTPITQTTAVSTSSLSTYPLTSGTYFYDASGTYSVARPFSQQSSFTTVPQSNAPQIRATQVHGIMSNQPMRFNPIMVVDQNRMTQFNQQAMEVSQEQNTQTPTTKITSSPRPSILRKRDHEGSPLKAAKNLAPQLGILPIQPQAPISPPSRPDSGGNGNSSGGSTTISATSSPGLAETNEDSMPHIPLNIKEEENARPPPEMSPRKKPRKQQLTGNDIDENMHEDMQFISETNVKKEPESDGNRSDPAREETAAETRRILRKPAGVSLLNSYRQTWKATHNHYLRYSDVKPKDERRPTIMDLSNQYRVLDKVNGWKVHHLSTQMEDLADQEQHVYNQLRDLLKDTEAEEGNGFDKDLNRINELIKGNLQRIKIINDGMIEAKTQIMKIFDHKIHVTDIISRCASKRNFKKREKS